MPKNVQRFEWLMYLGLAIGVVAAPFNERVHEAFAKFGPAVFFGVAVFPAIVVLIIWAIARQHQNWLRWTMLILFLIGLWWTIPEALGEFPRYMVDGLARVIVLVLHAMAYYFIFTGDAVPWFKKDGRVSSAVSQIESG